MPGLLLSLLVLSIFFVSTYGWGRSVGGLLYPGPPSSFAYNAALGVAVWIFLGGVLNALGFAYPAALEGLVVLGIVFTLAYAWNERHDLRIRKIFVEAIRSRRYDAQSIVNLIGLILIVLIVLVTALALTAWLLPSHLYNFHDDFHKYLFRPTRMLQTGSVDGNPFDTLGIDSLGAQTFLQAFVVNWFPITYINGYDAVFSFILCMFLIVGIAKKVGAASPYTIAALIVFVLIDTWPVNTSSVYSGASMILGLIYASLEFLDGGGEGQVDFPLPRTIPMALFLAAMLSLKATFVFFAVAYGALFLALVLFLDPQKIRIARAGVGVTLMTGAGIAPWMLGSWRTIAAVPAAVRDQATGWTRPAGATTPADSAVTRLVSFDETRYGGSYADFTLVAVMLAILFIVGLAVLRRRRDGAPDRSMVLMTALCGGAVFAFFYSAYFFAEFAAALRYPAPVLAAVLPAVLVLLGHGSARSDPARQPADRRLLSDWQSGALLVVIASMVVILFTGNAVYRFARIHTYNSTIPFRFDDAYIGYNLASLSQAKQDQIRQAQSSTEPGATIFTWIAVPFHLDFSRNKIFVAHGFGITRRLVNLPYGTTPETLRRYFLTWGVRYVMRERNSFGMRTERNFKILLARSSAYLKMTHFYRFLGAALTSLESDSRVVYDDGRLVIFDIRGDGHGACAGQ